MPEALSEKELEALEKYEQPMGARDRFPYLKMMLFGEQGVGKTVLSCCFGKTLIISMDSGWESIKNWPDIEKNVEVVDYQGDKHMLLLARALATNSGRYAEIDTVVLDTVSQMQERYIDFLMARGKWDKQMRPQFKFTNAKDSIKYGDMVKELPGGDDYHAARNVFREPLAILTEAPKNVIFLAHTKKPGALTPTEEKTKLIPNITDGLNTAIGRNCGLYGHMVVKKIKGEQIRVIDFIKNEDLEAKSRINALNGALVKTETFVETIAEWQGRDDFIVLPSSNKIRTEA